MAHLGVKIMTPEPDSGKAHRKFRVRCLGPADKEHFFQSVDPVNQRICERCRGLQQRLSMAHQSAPMRTHGEDR